MLDTVNVNEFFKLEVRRQFNAPVETVFKAWTDPEFLAKWFGPKGFTIPDVKSDLKVGGEYAIAMQPPEGDMFYHRGRYTEINPPSKLAFTWILENQECDGSSGLTCETVVTISLSEVDGGTEILLVHDMLPTETARDGHNMGWSSSLDCLEEIL